MDQTINQISLITESLFQDEQLWRLENSRSLRNLRDKAGLFKDLMIVTLPDVGANGFITVSEDPNDEQVVLGVSNNATDFGAQVKKEKQDQNDAGQVWHRGLEDKNGHFTLENPHSKLFLTVNKESKLLEIEGD